MALTLNEILHKLVDAAVPHDAHKAELHDSIDAQLPATANVVTFTHEGSAPVAALNAAPVQAVVDLTGNVPVEVSK